MIDHLVALYASDCRSSGNGRSLREEGCSIMYAFMLRLRVVDPGKRLSADTSFLKALSSFYKFTALWMNCLSPKDTLTLFLSPLVVIRTRLAFFGLQLYTCINEEANFVAYLEATLSTTRSRESSLGVDKGRIRTQTRSSRDRTQMASRYPFYECTRCRCAGRRLLLYSSMSCFMSCQLLC